MPRKITLDVPADCRLELTDDGDGYPVLTIRYQRTYDDLSEYDIPDVGALRLDFIEGLAEWNDGLDVAVVEKQAERDFEQAAKGWEMR